MNTQENRTVSTIHVARASAAFLLVLVMGYTFSTTPVESAIDAPAVTAHQDLTPTPYFPAQYVNQGTHAEDHIQAF